MACTGMEGVSGESRSQEGAHPGKERHCAEMTSTAGTEMRGPWEEAGLSGPPQEGKGSTVSETAAGTNVQGALMLGW